MADPTTSKDVPAHVRFGNRLLEIAETVVDVGIAALLVVVAVTLLAVTAMNVPSMLGGDFDSTQDAALELLSVKAADLVGEPEFTDAAWEIGILGGLVLALGFTAWLLRLMEREPDETDDDHPVAEATT